MKRTALALIVIGGLIAGSVFLLEFLIPLYPAQNINGVQLAFNLQVASWLAMTLVLVGVVVRFRRESAARGRNVRILVLVAVVIGASLLAAYNYSHVEESRAEQNAHGNSKYRFSTDWVSANQGMWSTVLGPFKGKANIQGLEIGSFEGRSAIWFLENILNQPGSTLTCIDIFDPEFEATFDHNIAQFPEPERVIKIKAASQHALPTLKPNYFDFAYIDGSHDATDVLTDVILTWPLLKPGAVIIFDDYGYKGLGAWVRPEKTPRIAIDAFLRIYEKHVEVLHRGYQIALRKRTEVNQDSLGVIGNIVLRLQELLG